MLETHTALSSIEDADFAEEAANLAMAQTLSAGAQAAIALANRLDANHTAGMLESLVDEQPPLGESARRQELSQ